MTPPRIRVGNAPVSWGVYEADRPNPPFARVLEQRHQFLGLFDGGVFSGDVLLAKPQPEIYELVETRYGLEPPSTIFVDDLLANVLVARARGWQAVHFESAAQLEPHLAAWLP